MRWIKFILVLIIAGVLCCSSQITRASTNMDGGGSGGGTQDGTSSNYYSSGDDGVRITVLDVKTKRRAEGTYTIDYYRKGGKTEKAIIHFGKVSKIEYMGVGGYPTSRELQQSTEDYTQNGQGIKTAFKVEEMPTIVSNSLNKSKIDAIKNYFSDVAILKLIAIRASISYDELISGNYKIIIEPMIYITFDSKYIAMTAHEAAKLDMALGGTTAEGGKLRSKFVSFTHKNLPLSIFLKKKELGIKRWTGSKTERVNNGNILSCLGIGILSFKPEVTEVDIVAGSYTYRPNTDVITSINVSAGSDGDGATCDNPITVRFSGDMINTTDISGITIPPDGSRLVWIKWHTQNVKTSTNTLIKAEITKGGTSCSTIIPIVINPIPEQEPPNPNADDTKPSNWSDDTLPTFPKTWALRKYSSPEKNKSWHTYTCIKKSVWNGDFEIDEKGKKYKIYETIYEFEQNYYSASLVYTNAIIKPDTKTKKANLSDFKVKSGYGIEMQVTSNVSGSYSDISGMQTAVVYFPEFNYKYYRRIGKLPSTSLLSTIEFPINQYSIYKSRVHFLPIWFPDKEYRIYIETLDAWTPAGMLCDQTTASITVSGSLWDDWHVGVVPEFDN